MRYCEVSDTYATVYDEDGNVATKDGVALRIPSVKFVEAYFGSDLGILQPAVRWISDSPPTSVLLERPPEKRVLSINGEDFPVTLPWMLYMLTLNDANTVSAKVFCRPTSVFTTDDELFIPPLPLLSKDGTLDGFEFTVPNGQNFGATMTLVVQKVFEHLDGKEIETELAPNSWGTFKDTLSILEHWNSLDVETLLLGTEWMRSDVHNVSELLASTDDTLNNIGAFEFIEQLITSVAMQQALKITPQQEPVGAA